MLNVKPNRTNDEYLDPMDRFYTYHQNKQIQVKPDNIEEDYKERFERKRDEYVVNKLKVAKNSVNNKFNKFMTVGLAGVGVSAGLVLVTPALGASVILGSIYAALKAKKMKDKEKTIDASLSILRKSKQQTNNVIESLRKIYITKQQKTQPTIKLPKLAM